MSARRIENNDLGDTPYLGEVESMNLLKVGTLNIELENMHNLDEPVIRAGSFLECDGILYRWEFDDMIKGDISSFNGTVYIKTQIDEEGNLDLIYDTLSSVPEWNRLKKGYYAGYSRFLGSLIHTSEGLYHRKEFFDETHDRAISSLSKIIISGNEYTANTTCYSSFYRAFFFVCVDGDVITILKTSDNIRYEIIGSISSYADVNFAYKLTAKEDIVYFYFSYSNSGTTNYVHYISEDGNTFSHIQGIDETIQMTGDNTFDYSNSYFLILASNTLYYSMDLIIWNSYVFSSTMRSIYHCDGKHLVYANTPVAYYATVPSAWSPCSFNASASSNGLIFQLTDDLLGMTWGIYYLESIDGINFDVVASGFRNGSVSTSMTFFKGNLYVVLYKYLYKVDRDAGTITQISDDTYYFLFVFANQFFMICVETNLDQFRYTLDGENWEYISCSGTERDGDIGIDSFCSIDNNYQLFNVRIHERLTT